MSLVSISIVGNLTKAPEQMCFASGKVKTTLTVACNSPNRGKSGERPSDKADFYKVETWGKLAELTHKYLGKGNQVGASGRLILDHWQDSQGRERITPVVEANQISLPPRLHVVKTDDPEAEAIINPIEGELSFSETEESENMNAAELPIEEVSSPVGRSKKNGASR